MIKILREMPDKEFRELQEILNNIANARTKSDAAVWKEKADFIIANLKGEINGYAISKLQSAINAASHCAGQISDKTQKLEEYREKWWLFEREVTLI